MSKQIQLPVLISGLATKVDGSIKITLETRELPPEDAASLFSIRNTEAWAFIAPEAMREVKLPEERPDSSMGQKTPSRRLRSVIWRIWEQSKSGQDFETYYNTQMERIIEQLKGRLE